MENPDAVDEIKSTCGKLMEICPHDFKVLARGPPHILFCRIYA